MKFVIAAGGTAGHINPALALAEELQSRGHELLFVGTPQGLESRLVKEAGFEFFPVESSGFDRAKPFSAVTALNKVRKGTRILKKKYAEWKPDAMVGFGAYVEVAAARAAKALKIPVIIHEQNSVPGMANKMVAKFAHTIALTYPSTESIFAAKKGRNTQIMVTGNPVRRSVLSSDGDRGRAAVNVPKDAFLLFVFGGSLGAQHINQAVVRLKDKLLARKNLYIIHSAGNQGYEQVVQDLALTEEEQKRWQVFPYITNMGDLLKAADCVISRAGATSLAEISALAVPSLLIPYPYARGDHQTKNAAYLVAAQAAEMMSDSALDTDEFETRVFSLIDDKAKRDAYRRAALELAGEGAQVRLANAVELACRM